MSYQVIGIALVAVVYALVWFLDTTDIPKIKGLPEIPGVPIFGNLIQLGTDHARVAQRWVKKFGPVFQTRLGNRVSFSPADIRCWRRIRAKQISAIKISKLTWTRSFFETPPCSASSSSTRMTRSVTSESPTNPRSSPVPRSTPFTPSYPPPRASPSAPPPGTSRAGAAARLPPRPSTDQLRSRTCPFSTLNYGYRIDGSVDSELLKEVTHVEREISNFRSTSHNWQDYVPLLRLWSRQDSSAQEYRRRKDRYLTDMLDRLKGEIEKGTDKPCITGNILKDPEAKLNLAEVKSICLTMVSAGLDTVPGNLIMGMAYMSTSEGQAVQARVLKAIEEVYPDGDAWEKCLVEEKVPYITALVKEVLRYWTVIPICLPRTSVRDIPYKDTVIPAGTTFFMNAYAANYDQERFKFPDRFIPERYLDDTEVGTPHYAYDAGSRMCAGSHLANRELYTAYIRLITAFEMFPSDNPDEAPCMDCLDCNSTPTSLTLNPKPFKIRLRARSEDQVRRWIAGAEERTAHLR